MEEIRKSKYTKRNYKLIVQGKRETIDNALSFAPSFGSE